MLEPDLVRDLLAAALSTGGRFAELFAEERDSVAIRLDDGRIEEVVAGPHRRAGVRGFPREAQAPPVPHPAGPAPPPAARAAAAGAGPPAARPLGAGGH